MRCFLTIVLYWACFFSLSATEKPNIVLILADDFGVGDIQAHYPENKIPTPYLDKLVTEGMSFTDAHSPSAVCSPTRYGLLTGRYNWRTRLQEWVIAAYEPPLITADRPTLPGLLQQHDYHTACVGKWHLGWDWPGPQASKMTEQRNGQWQMTWDLSGEIPGGPVDRGFDYYFGVDLPNLPPFGLIENRRFTKPMTDTFKLDKSEGIVLPGRFQGAPAAPGWSLKPILPTITQKAVDYIQQRAQSEEPFFLYFSMTSPHEPVVPNKPFVGQSGIAPIADFVMETDFSAGQIIEAIDKAGLKENTIVIFTADNGHSHYTGWPDLIKAGHKPSGPYRGHKGDIWEGGHRVPLVVRWPDKVEAGSSSDQLVCLTDIFATCADVIDAELPTNGAEDSLSFLAALNGDDPANNRQAIVNHSNFGEFAYREGDWKLVFKLGNGRLQSSRGKPTIAELYNLADDIDESENLAESHPEVVKRLTKQLKDLIESGATRTGLNASNDTKVRFDITQRKRWAPAINK